MKYTHKRTGFTLIELLVVIAIIAILAAILFPVFAKARAKARATACLSNAKQIGLSLQMYVQDYDGALPFAWGYGTGIWFNGVTATADYLMPYASNKNIFSCPSRQGRDTIWDATFGTTGTWASNAWGSQHSLAYGLNIALDSTYPYYGTSAADAHGFRGSMDSVPEPASKIGIGEMIGWIDAQPYMIARYGNKPMCNAHGGSTFNVVFLDGHAKGINFLQSIKKGSNMWNPTDEWPMATYAGMYVNEDDWIGFMQWLYTYFNQGI